MGCTTTKHSTPTSRAGQWQTPKPSRTSETEASPAFEPPRRQGLMLMRQANEEARPKAAHSQACWLGIHPRLRGSRASPSAHLEGFYPRPRGSRARQARLEGFHPRPSVLVSTPKSTMSTRVSSARAAVFVMLCRVVAKNENTLARTDTRAGHPKSITKSITPPTAVSSCPAARHPRSSEYMKMCRPSSSPFLLRSPNSQQPLPKKCKRFRRESRTAPSVSPTSPFGSGVEYYGLAVRAQ